MLNYNVLKLGYNAHAQKYKPLLHCTESLKHGDSKTLCLYMANEHKC